MIDDLKNLLVDKETQQNPCKITWDLDYNIKGLTK